eukprot:gene15442-18316_t
MMDDDHIDEDTPYAGDEYPPPAGSIWEVLKTTFQHRETRSYTLSTLKNIAGFILITTIFAQQGEKIASVEDLVKIAFGK